VKEVTVLLSSGYRDMDMAAVSALRKWSFAPLDRYEDQEGIILMTFSLR
jgi:TonB family protein